MNYSEAISYLYALQKHGIKFGLDNTIKLLSLFGNPHQQFRSIHVAGTNGKGSTSAMIASILQSHGYRVGLFTSPHLVSFTERIRINMKEIGERDIIELTTEIKTMIDRVNHALSPTFFEFVTTMAFIYFSRRDVDWAVIETGMGGRLDATNVIIPSVSVITTIGLDHQEFLGNTIRAIAIEKAGIIKEGIPVVSALQQEDALEVLINRAAEMGSEIYVYNKDFRSILRDGVARNKGFPGGQGNKTFSESTRLAGASVRGVNFDYHGRETFKNLYVSLSGIHQLENASLSIKTIEIVLGTNLRGSSVRRGLSNIRWPGRLELLRRPIEPYDFLIDGAHNPSAATALGNAIGNFFKAYYDRVIFIIGIMADKDIEGILIPLLPLSYHTIFTAPNYNRAASPESLLEAASKQGFKAESCSSIRESLNRAMTLARSLSGRTLIVVTGSFYTIGQALGEMGRKGILTRLRE